MKDPLPKLLEMGFTHLDKEEHFGKEQPDRFHYLYRKFMHNHQYVCLMYDYDGTFVPNNPKWGDFLEATFEAYWEKKNTRRPKGLLPAREMQLKGFQQVGGTLFRNTDDLVAAASVEYQLSPEEKKK